MTTTNPFAEPFPARLTWRGSEASARIIEDRVNRIDGMDGRGAYHPKHYATATTELGGVSDVYGTLIVDHSVCLIDAYDGRHQLRAGDTLVQTEDGWIVETPEDGS